MSKKKILTDKQQEYYNERVDFFKSWGVAVPYNLIKETALSMTDKECEDFLKAE